MTRLRSGAARFVPPAIGDSVVSGLALWRTSLIFPERPDRLLRSTRVLTRWLPGIASGAASSAVRYPGVTALVDDEGQVSYAELWAGAAAVARGLSDLSLGPGARVGILAGNSREFVYALLGAAISGADAVLLNTSFAPRQVADVALSEELDAVFHDAAHRAGLELAEVRHVLDDAWLTRCLAASSDRTPVRPPATPGAVVILTSGTTGTPKGAARHGHGAVRGLASLLAGVPLRSRSTTVNASPLFHAWGLTNLVLSLSTSSTTVLLRKFEAQRMLELVGEHRADTLVVVPVMLHRLLALDPEVLIRTDTSSLRVIAMSGSAAGAGVVTGVLDRFGPVLYNVYGSTEVATATVAGPRDLGVAPTTAGRVVPGVRVRILDDEGHELPPGRVGRVFVGSPGRFEGYTTGPSKEARDGMLSSGDLGSFSVDGLLFITGRDDEMIVSGGENVYPSEVAELLTHHPAVADVAVLGEDDDEFGQVLAAWVVPAADAAVTGEDLRVHVREQLARHKTPKRVVLVEEIPRNATGKVDRRKLRAL